jgi:cytochrome oxidase Cu insertion factor (SCO1/SenC/PrrC family)
VSGWIERIGVPERPEEDLVRAQTGRARNSSAASGPADRLSRWSCCQPGSRGKKARKNREAEPMIRGSLKQIAVTLAAVLVSAAATGPAPAGDGTLTLNRPLTFADAEGRVVRSTDFPGKWLLVYFGYTHCADLCPTGLSVLANAFDQIGPAAEHIQPLFVTVDPERDKGSVLRSFTEAFDKRLIGLGGTVEQIREAADALGVSFQKVVQGDSSYVVDHSSSYVLIDRSGTRTELLRVAEPHLLAAKLIEVLTKAGVPLGKINNVGAYR